MAVDDDTPAGVLGGADVDVDPVTGLPNGRAAVRAIEDRLAASSGHGRLWLVHLAVEDLPAIEAAHGARVADDVVVRLVSRVRRALRTGDLVFRLDRDQLLVTCPDLERDEAARLASRLGALVPVSVGVGPATVAADVSISLSSGTPGSTADSLLRSVALQSRLDRRRRRRRIAAPETPVADDAVGLGRALVEGSLDAILGLGLSGTVTSWNPAATAMFGSLLADPDGCRIESLVADGDAARVDELVRRVRIGERVRGLDVVAHGPDPAGGTRRFDLHLQLTPVRSSSGAIVGLVAVGRDVSERIELFRRSEQSRRRLEAAQALAGVGIIDIDVRTGSISGTNQAADLFGLPRGTVTPGDLRLIHPDDREAVGEAVQAMVAGRTDFEISHRIVRTDGEVRHVVTRPLRENDPASGVVSAAVLDVTRLVSATSELDVARAFDPITGLPNRASLASRLHDRLARSADGDHVAIAFVDLDHFKVVNDVLGHARGDGALRVIAARLLGGLRPDDLVARFGGDEFVAARTGVGGATEALAFGEAVRSLVSGAVEVGGTTFDVSASVGIALSRRGDSPDSLLRDADTAAFLAKEGGRAQVRVFEPSERVDAYRRLGIETALHRAICRDELSIELQPIVRLSSERVAGFEALLRWTHPTLGVVGPDEFIPIAEATGTIGPIGDWVLGRAVDQFAAWRSDPRLHDDVWIAVNLSVIQFTDPGLVDRIVAVVDGAGVPRSLVHLEITESVILDGVDDAADAVQRLRAHGFHISLDDFGTGYSSLSYLDRMTIDSLKIDRSFVQHVLADGSESRIIRTIVGLADALGITVIAEGVETEEQFRFLRALGCDHGQGWWWSPALPAADALGWAVDGPVGPVRPGRPR